MFSLEKWIENFEGYLEAKIELMKFDMKEYMVKLISKSISIFGLIFFGLTGFVLLNFGMAGAINHLLDSAFYGYLILALFYFFIAFLFFLIRKNKSLQQKIELGIRESLDHSTPNENESTQ